MIARLLIAAGARHFWLGPKVSKNPREKNASTLPAIFASGAAEAKMSIPANAGSLFSQPHAHEKQITLLLADSLILSQKLVSQID